MKVIHYINQFFGQAGGEDQADFEPIIKEGAVGCGLMLKSETGDFEVTHTLICGDNFMASRPEEGISRILSLLEGIEFDLFVAGPAFNAGRYGAACGMVGKAIAEKFDVPVISSMNEENPGVELYRRSLYIFKGGNRASCMKDDMAKIAAFIGKIARKETLQPAVIEGYFPRGVRHQVFLEDIGQKPVMAADRVVDMLLAKLNGQPYTTELPIPEQDVVAVAPAVAQLKNVKLALVTSGGIVPSGNPDRIQSCSATKWGKYDITHLPDGFTAGDYKTIHAGYDPEQADKNPNVVVPLDAIRAFQREGRLGEVDEYFYTTVGTGTTQNEAVRMGKEILEVLKERGVGAVLLTAT